MQIRDILTKYHKKLDYLDLELLIAETIHKSREFVLARPEYLINSLKIENLKLKISRRMRGEPLSYILGHKEFFGLDFQVNKDILIPRPETELLVEEVLKLKPQDKIIADIGTGSGNIIISLAKNLKVKNNFIATDISGKALKIAKSNAKKHGVDKKIKFFRGSLLNPIIGNWKLEIGNSRMIILANLPYLAPKIYASTPVSVKKYEPRSALYSSEYGLAHYKELLQQIKSLVADYRLSVTIFFEISPEQKPKIGKLAEKYFSNAKISFQKDLAGKWRTMRLEI